MGCLKLAQPLEPTGLQRITPGVLYGDNPIWDLGFDKVIHRDQFDVCNDARKGKHEMSLTFSNDLAIVECSIDADNYVSLRLRHNTLDIIYDVQIRLDIRDVSCVDDPVKTEFHISSFTHDQFDALL
jgi:hypothetical protein